MAPGGVELYPRRSQEVRGSPELQNGGLRALEEAWDDVLIEDCASGASPGGSSLNRRSLSRSSLGRGSLKQLDEKRLLVGDPEMLYEFSRQ